MIRLMLAPVVDAPPSLRSSPIGDRIIVRIGARYRLLKVGSIDWIEGDSYYSRIHARGRVYRLRETLSNLEASLGNHDFLRVHRSAIVNLRRVREFRRRAGGSIQVLLDDGTELELSRRRKKTLEDVLGRSL